MTKSRRWDNSCCRNVDSSLPWENISWCSLLVATPITCNRNLAMTISGGVDRTSLPNSDDDMDIVDSTDVSNWDEELAITKSASGLAQVQMSFLIEFELIYLPTETVDPDTSIWIPSSSSRRRIPSSGLCRRRGIDKSAWNTLEQFSNGLE